MTDGSSPTPLSRMGLSEAQRTEFEGMLRPGQVLARVTTVHRNSVEIATDIGPVSAELTGSLRHSAASELDLPAVGDWVSTQVLDDGTFAIVTGVLPRATVLRRRLPGKKVDYQMIAANVDTAFIVHPADQPVHVRRIERYLVVARDGGIEPVIVLSKSDTVSPQALRQSLEQAKKLAEALATSSVAEAGHAAIERRLVSGRTHVLLGPSGVGKSSLLNRLIGEEVFATRAIRADAKGRHTTTRRELVVLPSGAIVIDTPGMREIGLTDMQEGLDETFTDLADLAETCRFRDCTHTSEGGCALLAAVEAGSVDESRYRSWMRLEREAAHYERSLLEHRRRDKEFGRMVKSVMKHKKDRR